MSHIQLNYAFLLFWSILGKFQENFPFLSKKELSQKEALKYSEILFFLICLKSVNHELNLDLFKHVFEQTSKMGQILTKTVFLPKVNHIQLMLFCCFEAFSVKFTKNFSFKSKTAYIRKAHRNTESFYFLTSLKSGKSWGKFGFV